MRKVLVAISTAALVMASVSTFSGSARADNGALAAGVIGGLAVGTILGAAAAPRPYYAPRHYYSPAPVYMEPEPVYVAPPPRCYWTRGEPVWDDWRGVWMRPRMRVCD